MPPRVKAWEAGLMPQAYNVLALSGTLLQLRRCICRIRPSKPDVSFFPFFCLFFLVFHMLRCTVFKCTTWMCAGDPYNDIRWFTNIQKHTHTHTTPDKPAGSFTNDDPRRAETWDSTLFELRQDDQSINPSMRQHDKSPNLATMWNS